MTLFFFPSFSFYVFSFFFSLSFSFLKKLVGNLGWFSCLHFLHLAPVFWRSACLQQPSQASGAGSMLSKTRDFLHLCPSSTVELKKSLGCRAMFSPLLPMSSPAPYPKCHCFSQADASQPTERPRRNFHPRFPSPLLSCI